MKFLISLAILGIVLGSIGCGSTQEASSNTAAANTNMSNARIQNVDPNNLPPGLSASPIVPVGNNVPGISPANAMNVPKGITPAPGIPDPPACES